MKIRHRFDDSLDAHPDLKGYAERAAEILDREAAESDLPTDAVWQFNRTSSLEPTKGVDPTPVEVDLRDPRLPVVLRRSFSVKTLNDDGLVLQLLRLWTDFLGLRNHLLIEHAVQSLNSEK